jgi:hypothetical protein
MKIEAQTKGIAAMRGAEISAHTGLYTWVFEAPETSWVCRNPRKQEDAAFSRNPCPSKGQKSSSA